MAVGCGRASAPIHTETQQVATITGGVLPCYGVPIANGPRYVAATITVFQGRVSWQDAGPSTRRDVLPTTVVAQQVVAENATYRFTLPPGDYVLQGRFLSLDLAPSIGTTGQAGQVLHVDIPNSCK